MLSISDVKEGAWMRACEVPKVLLAVPVTALDISIAGVGIISSAASAITLGLIPSINRLGLKAIHSKNVLAQPYVSLLYLVNPYAGEKLVFPDFEKEKDKLVSLEIRHKKIHLSIGSSIISNYTSTPIFQCAFQLAQSGLTKPGKGLAPPSLWERCQDFAKRHVGSRLGYLVGAIVTLVVKPLDLLSGLCFGVVSLLSFGTAPSINRLALRQLGALSMINDLCVAARCVINPHQKR